MEKLRKKSLQEKLESEKQAELKKQLKHFMVENAKLKMSLTDYKHEMCTIMNEREALIVLIKKLEDKLFEKDASMN